MVEQHKEDSNSPLVLPPTGIFWAQGELTSSVHDHQTSEPARVGPHPMLSTKYACEFPNSMVEWS